MRFRPDARPDQLPPREAERRIHTVFNGTAHCVSPKAPTDFFNKLYLVWKHMEIWIKSDLAVIVHERGRVCCVMIL